MRFLGLICSFLCVGLLAASPSEAAEWVVSRVSGQAWLAEQGSAPVRAVVGSVVREGQTFSTGPGSRAKLDRDRESMLVGPNTVLSPKQSWWSGTTILQRTGQIELEVERRNVKHFSVETPFLAAVVKGTRFTVEVSASTADVTVSRGMVEVSDIASGEVADLAPGQKASVGAASGGLQVSGLGKQPEVRSGPARAGQIAPATGRGVASAAAGQSGQQPSGKDGSANGAGQGGGKGSDSGKGRDGGAGGKGEGGKGEGGGKGGGDGKGDSRGEGNGPQGGNAGNGNDGNGNGGNGNGAGGNGGAGGSGGNGGKGGGNGGKSGKDK